VNSPEASPVILKGHRSEVSDVAWCRTDCFRVGKSCISACFVSLFFKSNKMLCILRVLLSIFLLFEYHKMSHKFWSNSPCVNCWERSSYVSIKFLLTVLCICHWNHTLLVFMKLSGKKNFRDTNALLTLVSAGDDIRRQPHASVEIWHGGRREAATWNEGPQHHRHRGTHSPQYRWGVWYKNVFT